MKNSEFKTYRDVNQGDTLYAVHIDKLHYSVKAYELKVVSKLYVSTLDNPNKTDTCVIVCDPFMVVRFKTDDNPVSDLIYTHPDSTQGIVVLYADKRLANERLIEAYKNMQTLVSYMHDTTKNSLDMYRHIMDSLMDSTRITLF